MEDGLWNQIRSYLQGKIDPQGFETFLVPTSQLASPNGKLVVSVPNSRFPTYIRDLFQDKISEGCQKLGFPGLEIEYLPPAPKPAPPPPPPVVDPIRIEQEEKEVAREAVTQCPSVPDVCWRGDVLEFRKLIGPTIDSSDNFLLAGYMTLFASALSKSVHFLIPPNNRLYPIHYTVLTGTSGYSAKNTALKPMLTLFDAACNNIIKIPNVDSWEGLVKDVVNEIESGNFSNPDGPLCVMARLSELNSLYLKANTKGSKTIPMLKDVYDGSENDNPWRVSSVHGYARLKNADPLLSIIAGSEIQDLVDIGMKNLKGGLGNRHEFVPGAPKPENGDDDHWKWPDPERLIELGRRLRETLQFWWSMAREQGPKGSVRLIHSEAAHKFYWEWKKGYRKRGGEDAMIGNLSARDRAHCLKKAVEYACLDRSPVITLEHQEAASAYVDFLLQSRFFIFRNASDRSDARESQEMLNYIRERRGVSQEKFYNRFTRMEAGRRDTLLKPLLADAWNPDRPLRRMRIPNPKTNRKSWWLVPMTQALKDELNLEYEDYQASRRR
jgi:hypothetical protein